MDYYQCLASFLYTYRLGKASQAAKALHLTPAAVSNQIKVLEHKLKYKLFLREKQRLLPTEKDHQLANSIQES
jgi:DNA-binding transcriptional LysR family regulator